MNRQSFSLNFFPSQKAPEITITGDVVYQDTIFILHYSILGNIQDIFLPPPVAHPSRKDELWKTTCFEFFLAVKDQPRYWEFNLSPSGDWNVYCMDAYYRIGFREERSMQELQFKMQRGIDIVTLDAVIDLKSILPEDPHVEVGVTAVIQTRDCNTTYWALAHPGSQPDFHRRESFILALAGQTHLSPQSVPES